MLWNNPQIEIEHDRTEAENEWDYSGLSERLKNKVCRKENEQNNT